MIDWSPAISLDIGVESGVGLAVDYIYHPLPIFRNFPIETDVKKAVNRFLVCEKVNKESKAISEQISTLQEQSSSLEAEQNEFTKIQENNQKQIIEIKNNATEYIKRRDEFLIKQRSKKLSKEVMEQAKEDAEEIEPFPEPEVVSLTDEPDSVFEYRNYLFDYKMFVDNQRDLMQIERTELVKEMEALKTDHEKIAMQDRYNQEDHDIIKKKQEEISKIKYLTRTKYASFQKEEQKRELQREQMKIEKIKIEEIKKQIKINSDANAELHKKNQRAAKKLKQIRAKLDAEFKEVERKKNVLQDSVNKMNKDSKQITEDKKKIAQIRERIEAAKQKLIDEKAAIEIYKDAFQKEFAEIALEKQRIRMATMEIMEKRKEIPNKRKELGLPETPIEIDTPNVAALQQEIIFLQRDFDVSRAQLKMETDAIEVLRKEVYPKVEKPNAEKKEELNIFPDKPPSRVINGIRVVSTKDVMKAKEMREAKEKAMKEAEEKKKKKKRSGKSPKKSRSRSSKALFDTLSFDEEISDSMLEDVMLPSRKSRTSASLSKSESLTGELMSSSTTTATSKSEVDKESQEEKPKIPIIIPKVIVQTKEEEPKPAEEKKQEPVEEKKPTEAKPQRPEITKKAEAAGQLIKTALEKKKKQVTPGQQPKKVQPPEAPIKIKRSPSEESIHSVSLLPFKPKTKRAKSPERRSKKKYATYVSKFAPYYPPNDTKEEEKPEPEKEVVQWTFTQPRIIHPIVDSDVEDDKKEKEKPHVVFVEEEKPKKKKKSKKRSQSAQKKPKIFLIRPRKTEVTVQDLMVPRPSKKRAEKILIIPRSFMKFGSDEVQPQTEEEMIFGNAENEEITDDI